ncbi:MAG: hypothetical protein IJN82_01535, partial [Clostridia bacterium]|nr:hypothetical protein [Clostridia bacterium]
MRNVMCKKVIAWLSMLAMLLSLCPVVAVADGELAVPATAPRFSQAYTAMSGVALDADVADLPNGSSYISYWEDTAYTFMVGIDVFSNFEDAYNTILDRELDPNIFVLTGEHGDLTVTDPVTLYGYYYDVNPNQAVGAKTACPALNGVRQHDRESCVGNLHIAENVRGQVTVNGLVFQGNFVDATRPVNAEATDIMVKNCIVRQEAGVPVFETWAFNVNTYNNMNAEPSAAENKDSFTIKDCRVDRLVCLRICSNNIAPNFTVDGLVTVAGCTPFFGFPQWKRYTKDAVFTMKNCHFEDFYSSEGKNYFVVMEGLNKHNGACTINFENNTFRGDATRCMVEVYTKVGYDINIVGNTFIARNKTGLEPFVWNTTYDAVYSDSTANADVTNVDLSGIMEISKNRFIGYTKFSKTVNSLTTFVISDNFFTNDLDTYETSLGGFPTFGTGWKAASYWVDFNFKTYGTTIPTLTFTSSEIINGAAAKILYTDKSSINLYDYGMTLPKGVKFSISGGESATAISVSNGVRTIQIKVYSYDGTRSAITSLMIYGRLNYADAVAALDEANIRINSGCYTAASLSAYQTAATLLQNALTSATDPTEYIADLETAKAKLVFVSGAEAEMKYFDYFPTLRKFRIVDTNDWIKLTNAVTYETTLGGYTIR